MASIFAPERCLAGDRKWLCAASAFTLGPILVDPDHPVIPREALLAAAARAVLAALREPLEQRELNSPATAALRLLESRWNPILVRPSDG
jgi:hypothetical protein